jgi:hypothetical protein
METRLKVSFGIYLVLAVCLTVFGCMYLITPTVMPYHLQALGVPWNDLNDGTSVSCWGPSSRSTGRSFL